MAEPAQLARQQAINLLARREYSRTELRRRLLAKGHDEALVLDTLERLTALGLQSDSRFTEVFVRSRLQRGQGPMKIRGELLQRGISSDAAQQALEAAAAAAGGWQATLEDVWQRRFGAPPADQREWARQARFLAARGFSSEQVRGLLDAVGRGGGNSDPC